MDGVELVLGIDDTHLDVRPSFLKRLRGRQQCYVVSSWVETYNMLGRAYMLPLVPVHGVIVRMVMHGVPM